MLFGRKKEASDEAVPWTRVNPPRPAVNGQFRQPTDVTWDLNGDIFISDGYINSRVAKYDKNGHWVKQWGSAGSEPGRRGRLPRTHLQVVVRRTGVGHAWLQRPHAQRVRLDSRNGVPFGERTVRR
jgi:hypothetical protein